MLRQNSQYRPTTRQNGHILLVDDEAPIRKLISEVLGSRGYAVTQCCNGGKAVEYYSRNVADVDLVIMDIMMPEMNGTEALAHMLRINPDVKAIMISGGGYRQEDIRRTGAVGFAAKPFNIRQLLELVRQHVGRGFSSDTVANKLAKRPKTKRIAI